MLLSRFFLCFLVGFFLGLTNLYLALRLGFVYGVAILAAFAWVSLDLLLRRLPGAGTLSRMDIACYLSMASAMSFGCGTVVATSLSALLMLQESPPTMWVATVWVSAIGVLGTCLAFPLRVRLLAQLPFPSGQAASATVVELTGEGGGLRSAWGLGLVSIWVLLRDGLGWFPQKWVVWGRSIHFELSPMLLGLGILLGPQVCLGMLAGACFFFLAAPSLWGDTVSARLPFFAVGLMVSAGILAFGKTFMRLHPESSLPTRTDFKPVMVMSVVLLGTAHVALFGFSWAHLLLIALLVKPLATLSCRITGETDVVPTGALGKLSLLCFALFRPGDTVGLLAATGVLTGASASSADFMTDLRSGQDLGCPPSRQFRYQLVGAALGPLFFVPLLYHLIETYPLGGAHFPAPAARIWLDLARVMSGDAVDQGLVFGLGLLVGALVFVLKQRFPAMPGATPFAMAVFLDWGTCATLAVGALLPRVLPVFRDRTQACVMIAAESAMVLLVLLLF